MALNSTVLWILLSILICLFVIVMITASVRRQRRQREMFLASVFESPHHQRHSLTDLDDGIVNGSILENNNSSLDSLAELGFNDVLVSASDHNYMPTQKRFNEPQLISLHVIAPDNQPYLGYELLQALLTAGLRHGPMQIFHYYDEHDQILFSLASATEPGIFDLQNMGGFMCKGLTLFINLNECPQPQKALTAMHAIAEQLADDLGGQLKDEQYQPWSQAAWQAYQKRILADVVKSS